MDSDWFVWELLLRLPSKSVVRCKLVSKRWASLISDPLFVRSYLSHHSSPKQWTVIGRDMINHGGVNLMKFHEYDLPVEMRSTKHSLGRLRRVPSLFGLISYKVFATSNGLILFGPIHYLEEDHSRYDVHNFYYLCNPVTGESIQLPPLPAARKFTTNVHRHWGPALVTRVENAVLESYRVVLLLPYGEEEGGHLRICVFASETLEWDDFVVPCEIPWRDFVNGPTTLNERVLHWACSPHRLIAAYDPYAEPHTMRVVEPPPLPQSTTGVGYYWQVCDASGGKLRYFEKLACLGQDGLVLVLFRLWVHEEGAWRLAHETSSDDGGSAAREVMMYLSPVFSDGDVLYMADSRRLVSYDFESGRLEVVEEYATRNDKEHFGKRRLEYFLVETPPLPVSINAAGGSAPSTNLIVRCLRIGWKVFRLIYKLGLLIANE